MATGRIGTTPVLQVRWSKAPSAGTTSLSGLDDNSVSLVYSVGYEAVYRNGVLLSRGNDYTATNGTTITLIDATITGDIIEVFANATIPLTDTYSQTVANGKFINNTLTTTTGDIIYASAANTPARLGIGSTDQVLKVSGGIPAWATPAAAGYVGVGLSMTAQSQSITNQTYTALTFGAGSEEWDTDGFHDTSTNTSRITIPTGKGGKYAINGLVFFNSVVTTAIQLAIYKNGSALPGNTRGYLNYVQAANSEYAAGNTTISLAAGDYIELFVYANSNQNEVVYDKVFIATYLGA